MRCTDCSRELRPVVAVDIDGTMADYHGTFTAFVRWYFGRDETEMPAEPWDGQGEMEDYLRLTKHQYREAKLAYRQGGNKRTLPIHNGAKELCHEVRAMGAELWVATSRPWQRLDNIDPDTRFWLDSNDIEFDGILYGDDKYTQLLKIVERERIAGVIEDLPEQIEVLSASGIPFFQHYQPHNSSLAGRWSPGGTLAEARLWITYQINDWKAHNDV